MKQSPEYALPFMVVIGIVLSLIIGRGVYQYEARSIQLNFKNDVDDKVASIERELVVNLEVLFALKGFWDNSKFVSLKEFTRYSQSLLDRHKGIQALEWAPKVTDVNRESLSNELPSEEGVFNITERHEQGHMIPASVRDEYFPVYYLEPFIGNKQALGFDLASNSSRKNTLMMALKSGQPLATSSIILVQEPNNEKGFLILVPIYSELATTVINRQKYIKGFIVGVFRIGDIFRTASEWSFTGGINAKLLDVTNGGNELLYESNRFSTDVSILNKFSYSKRLKPFNGRDWQVIATPALEYIESRRSYLPYFSGFSSMLFVLLAAYYTYLITLRNKELNKTKSSLEQLIETDFLTTISNRRCFDKHIQIDWSRAIR